MQRQSESSCKDVIIEGIRISWGCGRDRKCSLDSADIHKWQQRASHSHNIDRDRQRQDKSSPADERTHSPPQIEECSTVGGRSVKEGGAVVGGWHWLAAGGQRRTSRTHHHPCCGVLCINRLEVAEQGFCDTFGHNIYLIKLLLLPSLPDLDNNDARWLSERGVDDRRILGFSFSSSG